MNRKIKKYSFTQEVLLRMLCLDSTNTFVTNIIFSPRTGTADIYVTGDYVEQVPEGHEVETQQIY